MMDTKVLYKKDFRIDNSGFSFLGGKNYKLLVYGPDTSIHHFLLIDKKPDNEVWLSLIEQTFINFTCKCIYTDLIDYNYGFY